VSQISKVSQMNTSRKFEGAEFRKPQKYK